MKQTNLRILQQGDIKITSGVGYGIVGDGDAVCFWIDVYPRAYVDSSTESKNDCPIAMIVNDDSKSSTMVEFIDYPGWRFHASGGCAKTIAIALVRKAAEQTTDIPW